MVAPSSGHSFLCYQPSAWWPPAPGRAGCWTGKARRVGHGPTGPWCRLMRKTSHRVGPGPTSHHGSPAPARHEEATGPDRAGSRRVGPNQARVGRPVWNTIAVGFYRGFKRRKLPLHFEKKS
jgi:hypothetical protein